MVRLAIIGTGGMADGGHAVEFGKIPECQIVACCDVVPGKARAFADKHGIPAAYEDLSELLDRETLDAVTVVTPDQYHMEPVLQCIERGLHVMCEKPLASNLEDARRMTKAAADRGILTSVNFSYRRSASVQEAARMIREGLLGQVYHVEGSYLQSWLVTKFIGELDTNPGWLWRLSTRHGSAGTLGDIGVHLLDMASFVVGDIDQIACTLKTFDKPLAGLGEYVFDANDSMLSNVGFVSGAIGTLHSTRLAAGHGNSLALRVFGEKGGLDISLNPNEDVLRVCIGENLIPRIWETVDCPPVPNMYQRFITSIVENKQGQTSFAGALKVQAYLDVCMKASDARCTLNVEGDKLI